MEGNDWVELEPGIYQTQYEDPPRLRFSPLDLYLMGVLAPEDVAPFEVLLPERVIEPSNYPIAPDAIPARRVGIPVTIGARAVPVTMEHVVAGSGARYPPAESARAMRWRVGIVLVSRGRSINPIADELLVNLDARIRAVTQAFREATEGRIELVTDVRGPHDLDPRALPSGCGDDEACRPSLPTTDPEVPGETETTNENEEEVPEEPGCRCVGGLEEEPRSVLALGLGLALLLVARARIRER
jgi:hypothetical protein